MPVKLKPIVTKEHLEQWLSGSIVRELFGLETEELIRQELIRLQEKKEQTSESEDVS